jgi:arylsulfatase A-like enzyme
LPIGFARSPKWKSSAVIAEESIEELVDELNRRGLAGHTLVVVTSDHGQLFGEHGIFYHGKALYLDLIHVPLLLLWPAHVPAGLRIPTLVSTSQLPATILELAGSGHRDIFPGPSLAKSWRSGLADDWPYPPSELAQFHRVGNETAPNYHGSMASLVGPRWHYIAHQTLGEELYDWQRHPGEQHNLAGTAEAAPVMADFRRRMAAVTHGESRVKAVNGQQPRRP